jgi:guanine nucleotide-binding protein G(i) subunit alpha
MMKLKLFSRCGYNDEEREKYRPLILYEVLNSMRYRTIRHKLTKVTHNNPRHVLELMPALDVPLHEQSDPYRTIILNLPYLSGLEADQVDMSYYPQDVADALRSLWIDDGVKAACQLAQQLEEKISKNAVYFFNSLERLSSKTYIPTDQDIIRMSMKANSVFEINFPVGELCYHLIHPGNWSQRKRWLPMFEDSIDAFIFVANISEYSLWLYEDESAVRPQYSMIPRDYPFI